MFVAIVAASFASPVCLIRSIFAMLETADRCMPQFTRFVNVQCINACNQPICFGLYDLVQHPQSTHLCCLTLQHMVQSIPFLLLSAHICILYHSQPVIDNCQPSS